MTEMLWSDPGPNKGLMPSKRGVGVAFGEDVTEKFLKANGLELLIRSHECKDEGYEVEHGGKTITGLSVMCVMYVHVYILFVHVYIRVCPCYIIYMFTYTLYM